MEWTERNPDRLEIALTEAEIVGVRQPATDSVAFLIHVAALPEVGPMDNDARRMLVLNGVREARFLLRRVTTDGNGPAISIRSLAAVDELFESVALGGAMYGWRYFDDPELVTDWPSEPSHVVTLSPGDAHHTFYWFNECARIEQGDIRSYCIEGTVTFDDLTVQRADGSDQPTNVFADQGVRWWQAFQDFEPRVDVDAQRAWNASLGVNGPGCQLRLHRPSSQSHFSPLIARPHPTSFAATR